MGINCANLRERRALFRNDFAQCESLRKSQSAILVAAKFISTGAQTMSCFETNRNAPIAYL